MERREENIRAYVVGKAEKTLTNKTETDINDRYR